DRVRGEELQGRRQSAAGTARGDVAGGFHHQSEQDARSGKQRDALLGEGTGTRRGRRGAADSSAGGEDRGADWRVVPGRHGAGFGDYTEPTGPAEHDGDRAGD